MLYFGGGGVRGELHPSLRAYIDCFHSEPFPKMFPRGGGIWDQEPLLVRDFREIRKVELHYEEVEANKRAVGEDLAEGGPPNPDNLLDQYLQEQGMQDDAYF